MPTSRSKWLALCLIVVGCCIVGSVSAADPSSAADQTKSPQKRSSDEPLPGLVSAPRKLPGIARWQLARKSPNGRVAALAWNGDGTQIAFSDHSYVRLCDANTFETKKILVGHASEVTCIDWNHRTQRLASASCDGTVRIWTNDGVPERVLRPEGGEVNSVAWTSDGARLASACNKGTVCIWNADGSGKQTIGASKAPVSCIAWSPDHSRLVSGDSDGEVKLWAADGKLVRVCEGYLSRVIAVAWSPDGRHFAAATYGEDDPNTDRHHAHLGIYTSDGSSAASIPSESPNAGLCWSPDGQQIAIYNPGEEIRVCDARGSDLDRIPVPSFGMTVPGGIAWAPKEREVAVATAGGLSVIHLADRSVRRAASGRSVVLSRRPAPLGIWTRDAEKWLVQFSSDELFQVWSASKENPESKFPDGDEQKLLQPAWNPAGDQLAFVEKSNRLRVWQVGSRLSRLVVEVGNPIEIVAWSPNGDSLTVLDQAGDLQAVRIDGSTLLKRKVAPPVLNLRPQSGTSDSISQLAYRADGKSVAVVERDAIQVFPLDGAPAKTFAYERPMSGGWLSNFWWANDGLRMTSIRKDGHDPCQLVTWHLRTGLRTTITKFPDELSAIDCSPDGKLVVLGFDNGFWQLRRLDDLSNTLFESESAAHVMTIRSAAFANDGRKFATGGWDGVIKVWSSDGTLLQTLHGNDWPVHMLKWSADGQRLISVSRDRTTLLWSLKTGRPELSFEISDGAVSILTRDGRIFGPSPGLLNQEFVGLVEKPSGEMEIVGYSEFLALQPHR
jgi:WD40 repeat protein